MISIAPLEWSHLLIAAIIGLAIGLERQLSGKPAGMRTSALICLSTYAFVAIAVSLGGDSARIIGQIVTGVGFLGGGVIISKEGVVLGMTSAACIWILAAIGAAVGVGYINVAIVLGVLTLCVLSGMNFLEKTYKILRRGVHRSASLFDK